jgi:hypothetical protein
MYEVSRSLLDDFPDTMLARMQSLKGEMTLLERETACLEMSHHCLQFLDQEVDHFLAGGHCGNFQVRSGRVSVKVDG